MLSILVCHSYFLRFDPKQVERAKPYPPLATLQVAGLLRQAGHHVALFDAMLATGIEEYDRKLAEVQPQVVLFYEDTFNFLSKMCLGKMREAACQMIGTAHRAGARVIACGPDVSDAPEPYLRAGAEVALMGEGLATLLDLIPKLDGNARQPAGELIEGLSGTMTLVNGAVVKINGARVLANQAHTGEAAAWDLLDIERYRSMWLQAHGYFSLNMAASRGCSFRCSWCAKPIWGNQYLQRAAVAVANEMLYLKRTFKPDHIWFADDIFGFRVDWLNDFAATLQAAGGGIPFTIQTRADLLSERMAAALAAAGCREAWIGAESGSQRVLDAMNKGTTVTEIVTGRERLKGVGIRVGFFIQLGYLDEQLSDILATRALLELARPDDVGVSVSYPLPGTRFYELVKAQLNGKTHWRDSDDLAMMFQGTYTSEFYRAVRNLIHDQVTLQTVEPAAQNSPAKRALERRWHDLIARERLHRTQPIGGAAQTG
ncbi:MAG: B12-binding domain-containing radical SAM protein [Proteobacteria bacterium]|nr:B12-binding domain-containing radical SAM protein [Pseudomonadota bacterium]